MAVKEVLSEIRDFITSPTVRYTKNLFTSNGSIMSVLNPFIVEPTIFVSESVRNDDPDIMHRAITEQVDIFCGFYSMAFKIMNELSGSKSDIYLKKLSTSSHDYATNITKTAKDVVAGYRAESYSQFFNSKYDGNEHSVINFNNSKLLSSCFESFKDKGNITFGTSSNLKTKNFSDGVGYGIYTRFFELTTKRMFEFQDDTKDSNGNLVNPDKRLEEKTLVIPICIRAHIVFFSMEDISTVFNVKGEQNSFTQRYWKWRSGGISFKEFILATDLINEYRKKKLSDKNTILDIINGKTYNSTVKAIIGDGTRSYEKFFNLYVLSGNDIEQLEKALRNKMNNQSFAQSVMEKLQAMELMVIDTEYNTGQMFIHTMPTPATFPLNKLGKRKENSDLSDLLKSLYANKAPMF